MAQTAQQKRWYETNKAQIREQRRGYYQKNKERIKQRYRERPALRDAKRERARTPRYRQRERERKLRSKYGITVDQYDALLKQQGGVCAVCSGPPSERSVRLVVDHDHASRMIRGLLCSRCNRAIGLLNDSADLLRRASRYLTEARHA